METRGFFACPECGRTYTGLFALSRCPACETKRKQTHVFGVPRTESTTPSKSRGNACPICGRTIEDAGAECALCRLGMVNTIQRMTDELRNRQDTARHGAVMLVHGELEQKRRRTGTYRFYPAPRSIRGGFRT